MEYIKLLGLILIGAFVVNTINGLIGVNDALDHLSQGVRITHIAAQTVWGGTIGLYVARKMM